MEEEQDNNYFAKILEIQKSYISKEEFIDIISRIDFLAVRSCEISLLTGFLQKDDDIRELSKRIEIS